MRPKLPFALLCAALYGCPDRVLEEANTALKDGRLEDAGKAFLAAARADPAHLAAWDGAISVFCKRRVHVAKCLEVLDLELELLGSIERHRNALAQSLEARARARLEKGLARAALDDLKRAEKAAPEQASIALAQARAWVMLGLREDALDALDRARTLDPKNPGIDSIRQTIPAPPAENLHPGDGFGGQISQPEESSKKKEDR